MKKLGLVGGMGPQSTVPYYMNIVYGVQQRTAPEFFPNITIESLNVFEILEMIGREEYDTLTEHFLLAVKHLQAAGAEVAALTANTAHIVFDRLAECSPIPLISIIEATVGEARRRGYKRMGLLGTIFTMERDFYKVPFRHAGIEVIIPDADDRRYIDEKITTELELGIISEDTRRRFVDIITALKREHGIQAVILGCTELPLLLSDDTSPVPCLDTVRIHSDALIGAMLDEPSPQL